MKFETERQFMRRIFWERFERVFRTVGMVLVWGLAVALYVASFSSECG